MRKEFFKLGGVLGLFILSILIALPRIPIQAPKLGIDTSIGGYYINVFNGLAVFDLRDVKKGLDLSGGVRLVLKADMSKIVENERDLALESAREVISRRVDYLGVSEPHINTLKTADEYRIEVEIPGLEDVRSAISAIGTTAQLRFKVLKPEIPWSEDKYQEYAQNPEVWQDSDVSGADLKGADLVFSQGMSLQDKTRPQIQMKFSPEGRKKFSQLAKDNVNKPVGIFFEDSPFPLSMPVVDPDLAEGVVTDPVISGTFDVETAKALSLQIRAGALPVPIEIIEQKTIDATLGKESVDKSLVAGAIGLLGVMIFMVIMYGKLGLIANFALLLYSAITISIFKLIPVTLSLPGIAGFILSVGMAVDASILVFERIREELNWGKPRGIAIKLGFERSWSSIKDSNISSLITAFILFYFGSGMVRGFALTLSIGIIVSLFTSVVVVRTIIRTINVLPKTEAVQKNGSSSFLRKFRLMARK